MADNDGGGEEKNVSPTNATELKIGDKVVTAKDVENLLNQQASLTQESQKVAALRSVADKYGVNIDTYVKNAEGAIAIASKLMEEGVLDEHGNLVKKEEGKQLGVGDGNRLNLDGHQKTEIKPDPRMDGLVKAIDEINKKLTTRDKDITSVMKLGLKRDIMAAHPELNDSEALAVLDKLQENPNKTVWEHAKEAVENKKTFERELEEKYAKTFGVDIEQFRKRNEQKIQGNEGASAIVGEKKIVFGSRKRLYDKDKVATPREALVKFMNQSLHNN
jgi:hypothetical protein